jgi:spermidine/putrescine transport system permease protein
MMIGNLTQQQFLRARNWPFGSAASIILMAIVSVAVFVYFRYTEERER